MKKLKLHLSREYFDPTEHGNFLYKKRCICKEEKEKKKKEDEKPDVKKRVEGKPVQYPILDDTSSKIKTFQILHKNVLSLETRLILNSFQKKYLYYAVDDILYAAHLDSTERDNLLALIYSPILSLHNSICVDFFDTWIHELYIDKILEPNRFLMDGSDSSYQITIKILYKTKNPTSKRTILW